MTSIKICRSDINSVSPRSFTPSETYQYGFLMALAEEQSEAMDKLINRSLGWWGRSRIEGRVNKMVSLLNDLIVGKQLSTRDEAISQVRADLQSIKHNGLSGEFYSIGAFMSLESVFGTIS